MYIQPYTNFNWQSLMNSAALKIHMQIIRMINSQIRIILNYRINCIIQKGIPMCELYAENDGVITIVLNCDTEECDTTYILSLYTKVLQFISVLKNVTINILNIITFIESTIDKSGINPTSSIGPLKWLKNEDVGFQIEYIVSTDSILTLYINIINKNNQVTRKIDFMMSKCGAVIENIIQAYIGNAKWISTNQIEIRKPNKKDFWVINTSGEVDFFMQTALNGNAHKQYDLAIMYETGNGVIKNTKKMLIWLKKAAMQGNRRAIMKLEELNLKYNDI